MLTISKPACIETVSIVFKIIIDIYFSLILNRNFSPGLVDYFLILTTEHAYSFLWHFQIMFYIIRP